MRFPRPTGARRAPLVLHAALALAGLCLIAWTAEGWFSADEVVMAAQSQTLAAGSWTTETDPSARLIDPNHQFLLLARSGRLDGEVAPYVRHPLAPLLIAGAETALGNRWRLLPGVIAAIAASVLFWRSQRGSIWAFWMALGATTLFFHTTVLWAHSLGFALAMVAALAATRIVMNGGSQTRGVGGLLVAVILLCLLRSEGLLLAVALAGALPFSAPHPRRKLAGVVAVSLLASAGLTYVAEPWLRARLLGGATSFPTVPASGSGFFTNRLDVARILFVEPTINDGVAGSLRLLGVIVLVVASVLVLQSRASTLVLASLSVAGVCFYLVSIGSGPAPGFFVAMPLFAVAVPWLKLDTAPQRLVLATAALFAVLVVLTSYDNAGGGDWGGRYLFIGVPFLMIGAFPALVRLTRGGEASRVVLGAGVVCALAIQLSVAVDFFDRRATVDTVDAVARTADAALTGDDQVAVAVSDERLSRFLYDRGLRGASFHVPPEREAEFAELLDDSDISRIVWIDLGSAGDQRNGELQETQGSVSIRTVVRR